MFPKRIWLSLQGQLPRRSSLGASFPLYSISVRTVNQAENIQAWLGPRSLKLHSPDVSRYRTTSGIEGECCMYFIAATGICSGLKDMSVRVNFPGLYWFQIPFRDGQTRFHRPLHPVGVLIVRLTSGWACWGTSTTPISAGTHVTWNHDWGKGYCIDTDRNGRWLLEGYYGDRKEVAIKRAKQGTCTH